jgi:hypothetical protein
MVVERGRYGPPMLVFQAAREPECIEKRPFRKNQASRYGYEREGSVVFNGGRTMVFSKRWLFYFN